MVHSHLAARKKIKGGGRRRRRPLDIWTEGGRGQYTEGLLNNSSCHMCFRKQKRLHIFLAPRPYYLNSLFIEGARAMSYQFLAAIRRESSDCSMVHLKRMPPLPRYIQGEWGRGTTGLLFCWESRGVIQLTYKIFGPVLGQKLEQTFLAASICFHELHTYFLFNFASNQFSDQL